MAFSLPDLPYDYDALEPAMSAETLKFHHDKHHNSYVEKLNKAIEGTELEKLSLEEIIQKTADDKDKKGVFNNAAQTWNHSFFWSCMTPKGGGKPEGALASQIDKDFGSYDAFRKEFLEKAAGQFGSGWAWLVIEAGKLKVVTPSNADLPMTHGQQAILTCDVWEHAYYLDYQNKRAEYLNAFVDHLINWDFVNKLL